MSTFHIKRGDVLPALVADLKDAFGQPVNLAGSSVMFRMASTTGDLIISRAAAIDVDVPGRVRYFWLSGDTDLVGDYNSDFVVTKDGSTQSFPTSQFTKVQVVPDITDAVGVSSDDIDFIRTATGENESTTFSALDIASFVNRRDGDLNTAIHDVWMAKAAGFSDLVDVSESGSSRKLSDLAKNAREMAKVYLGYSLDAIAAIEKRPNTRAIVRP